MIRVTLSGVVEAGTECVLRSVSSELEPDTPESRRIELGAGSGVVDRLRAMGTLPVGAAVITPGGELPVSFIIHVVLQSPEEPVRMEGVRLALENGLRRAHEWSLDSLAMPPLGTGAGKLGADEAAEVMVPLIQEHIQRYNHPSDVVIAVANEYDSDVFLRAVERVARRPSAQES
jgi:O-acetyl-ADP-ribose deacetylase (regulator of RNase III)